MAEIIHVYRQTIPAVKFIGKKYGDEDRVNGSFAECWKQWMNENYLQLIHEAAGGEQAARELCEDGEACLGYMRYKQGEPFQYWIGKFVPPATKTPEGLEAIEIDAATIGVCWVKGKEPDIYMKENLCAEQLVKQGMHISRDKEDALWFFERYSSPRFFEPDDAGNIIVDICYYIQPEQN